MTTTTSENSQSDNRTPQGRRARGILVVGVLVVGALIAAGVWLAFGRVYVRQYRLQALLDQGQVADAAQFAEQHFDQPGNSEICLLMAQALRMSDQLADSDRLLKRHETLIDSPTRVSQHLNLNRARRGQLSGVDVRLPALLRDPLLDERDVCEAFAIGFRLNRRFDEAAQLLDAWRRDWPQDYRPHYHEGLMRQTLTSWQKAIESYERALRLDPQARLCRQRLGECLNQLERGSEAARQFSLLTDSQPDDAAAWEGLANALKQTGDFPQARAAYLKVLELMPENFAARLAIAEIDLDTDDAESAATIASGLLDVWPEDVATLYVLSRAEAVRGNVDTSRQLADRWTTADQAVQEIERDIQRLAESVNDVDLQVSLGCRMLKHYSRDMGLQFIGVVLQIDPQHAVARDAFDDYQQRTESLRSIPVPKPRTMP